MSGGEAGDGPVVDLRSDTVTRPGPAMRKAMAEAEVGDVCWGDDPTVSRLEAVAAERLGQEAAIFVPSGTMGNQIGLAVHTRPGDAVILERRAHIAQWETGGAAATHGLQTVLLDAEDGFPTVAQLQAALYPESPKAPRNRLVCLEDTHNAAGGIPHGPHAVRERVAWAHSVGLAVHLDGARVFNAAIATGCDASELAGAADSVSVCLSKGLGAPIGSIFAASRDAVAEGDRVRHRLGGGWRQAGVIAAAGLYVLEHHVARLADDHARASQLAEALVASGIATPCHPVRTNIVYFDVDPDWGTAEALCDVLAERGVLVGTTGPQQARLVTHLDVDDAGVEIALDALRSVA